MLMNNLIHCGNLTLPTSITHAFMHTPVREWHSSDRL